MHSELIFLRKKQLQNQITDAINLGDNIYLSSLQAQWVHRYGVDTLPSVASKKLDVSVSTFIDKVQVPSDDVVEQELILEQQNFLDISNKFCGIDKSIECEGEDSHDVEELSKEPSGNIISFSADRDFDEIVNCAVSPPDVPSPPVPILNRFRRWLPLIDESMPKAS